MKRKMHCLKLRSTMRATRCVVGNSTLAIGTETGFGFGRFRSRLAQLIYELNKQEDAQSDDKEIEHVLNKGTYVENRRVFALAQSECQGAEINAAGENRENGSEKIFYYAVNDVGESAADHNTNGHIDYIAFKGKFFKFRKKLMHDYLPPNSVCHICNVLCLAHYIIIP